MRSCHQIAVYHIQHVVSHCSFQFFIVVGFWYFATPSNPHRWKEAFRVSLLFAAVQHEAKHRWSCELASPRHEKRLQLWERIHSKTIFGQAQESCRPLTVVQSTANIESSLEENDEINNATTAAKNVFNTTLALRVKISSYARVSYVHKNHHF